MAVRDVSQAIVESLAAQYISIPTGQGLCRIVNGFSSKWGFPQCLSHSRHCPLRESLGLGYHSVILQALVDHNYRLLDVYVG